MKLSSRLLFQLNENVNTFQRKFVNEVRRCGEMERKLRYIETEVKKDKVSIPDVQELPKAPNPREIVTKSWPVTAPGSQGVFRGRGRGFGFLKNGRQAAIVLSWLLLVQLPGQVLRSYSSKVSKSKRFLIVKQILVYSVTAKLSTEQYLVVRYWFTRMR
jgi:hypothetical protein